MVSHTLLSLLVAFSASTFAQSTDSSIHLEKCATASPIERKEAFLFKVDCVYRILGEQVGGDNELVRSTIMNGKFKEASQKIKESMREYLGTSDSKNDFESYDNRLLTARAVQEVTLPSVLPMVPLNTIGQLRDAHVDLIRKSISNK